MRNRLLNTLLVIVACGGLLPTGLWAQEDANIPWDPNTHLAPYPEGMARTRHFVLPEDPESPWTLSSRITLELSGGIEVTDPNGLIGLDTDMMGVHILDELGEPIGVRYDRSDGISYRPVAYTSTFWVPTGETTWSIVPYEFSVEMMLNADIHYPSMLSQIEWSMRALLSDSIEVVDLPFAASEDWVELAPGLEILIEQTSIAENRYEHKSSIIFDPNRIAYPYKSSSRLDSRGGLDGYLWPSQGFPETIVLEIDVFNAEGVSIQNHGEGGRSLLTSRSGYFEEGRMSQIIISQGSGRDAAAFIRYVIAIDPYRQEVRLALEDVPVPGL